MLDTIPDISKSTTNIIDSLPYLRTEWIVICGFLLVIGLDLFIKRGKTLVAVIASLVLLVSVGSVINNLIYFSGDVLLFNGMLVYSKSALLFKLLVLVTSLLSLIFFYQDRRLSQHPKGINDFISVFLAGVLGMLLLVSTGNLLMLFISIEMISLVSYIMVSYNAYQRSEAEGGMKYVLFGIVASAIMLYGISLIYGFTGTINLYQPALQTGLNSIGILPASIAVLMLFAGISFKLSAVPFHFWTPDAYQVAPTSVTSFLSTVPKIAVFGFLYYAMQFMQSVSIFTEVVIWFSAASMLVGNILAVLQSNAKRMLAYSAIGHTGFLLMLFVLPQVLILKALVFYLVVYALANVTVFMSFNYLEESANLSDINDYKGLGKQLPLLGVCLIIVLISLTGLPPTAGFIAKFLTFSVLINTATASPQVLFLLVIAAVTTVISLFYYLKIPLNFFIKKESQPIQLQQIKSVKLYTISILVLLIILLGVFPTLINGFLGSA